MRESGAGHSTVEQLCLSGVVTAVRGWNPRFLAYCEASGGLGPEDTLKRDGNMVEFIIWGGKNPAVRW